MADDKTSAPAGGGGGLFNDLDMADMRSMDDFMLSKARFQVPPTNDFVRWNNRMVSNLLYYQSNYFVVVLVIFALVGVVHPTEVLLGLAAVLALLAAVVGALGRHPDVVDWRQRHPLAQLFASLAAVYFAFSLFSSVVVFLYGLLLPVLLCLVHASVRLRSVANKLGEQMEKLGMRRTLMGRMLELAGVDVARIKWD